MDTKFLALYLAELKTGLSELRAAGIRSARIPLIDMGGEGTVLYVEFFPPESSRAPVPALMDRDGKPINLDEGMPELARDDIAEANFNPKPKAA